MKKIVCALLLLLIFVISGCAENTQPKKVDANGAPKLSLNVCSSMSEAVTKLLVEEYAEERREDGYYKWSRGKSKILACRILR